MPSRLEQYNASTATSVLIYDTKQPDGVVPVLLEH